MHQSQHPHFEVVALVIQELVTCALNSWQHLVSWHDFTHLWILDLLHVVPSSIPSTPNASSN